MWIFQWTNTHIHLPEFLHSSSDSHNEKSFSENIEEAPNRWNLHRIDFIVLYTIGTDYQGEGINKLLIAPVKNN